MRRGGKTITSEMEIEGIKVTLKKKAGLKNLYMRVNPKSGGITVSAPLWLSLAEIRSFAGKNLDKILALRKEILSAPEREKCGYTAGETHYLWGKPYTLLEKNEGEKYALEKAGDKLILTVPYGTGREIRSGLFTDFYFKEIKEAMIRLLPECEEKTGLHAKAVWIRNMKSCWGSCSAGRKRISINLQLAKLDPACLKYIVFHELVHFREKKHGRLFYAHLDACCPQWKEADKILAGLSLGYMAENML